MSTHDWDRYKDNAKVLVIGHDPRLRNSESIANYCFFADYYFDKVTDPQYLKKKALATSVFDFVIDVSEGQYKDTEVYITNLCNDALPSAPPGKTVFIPRRRAESGVQHIREILSDTKIEIIFAMSEQVNYWLQELGFYNSENGFLEDAKPSEAGIESRPRFYTPAVRGCFKKICGNEYKADDKYSIFPILHVKNYPLRGKFVDYLAKYDVMKTQLKVIRLMKKQGY